MINLIIVGAGGFGLEVAAYAEDITRAGHAVFAVQGFLDDTKPVGSIHGSHHVLGDTNSEINENAYYTIAVGDPLGRQSLAEKLSLKGARWAKIVHPLSYVAATARLGEGVIIAPFAFVGAGADVGQHALVNIYASAGHETKIGAYASLAPYACLHGQAVMGDAAFVGTHSTLTAGLTLGEGAKLAAGSIAYNDIPERKNALGNPARFKE